MAASDALFGEKESAALGPFVRKVHNHMMFAMSHGSWQHAVINFSIVKMALIMIHINNSRR